MKYVFFIGSLLLLFGSASAALTCETRPSGCTAGETAIFSLSAAGNAHGATGAEYGLTVCCSAGGDAVTLLDSSICSTDTIFALSQPTNGHASFIPTADGTFDVAAAANYTERVCLRVDNHEVTCRLYSSGGTGTCVATLSGQASGGGVTNAHLSDCTTAPYPWKVLCDLVSVVVESGLRFEVSTNTPVTKGTPLDIVIIISNEGAVPSPIPNLLIEITLVNALTGEMAAQATKTQAAPGAGGSVSPDFSIPTENLAVGNYILTVFVKNVDNPDDVLFTKTRIITIAPALPEGTTIPEINPLLAFAVLGGVLGILGRQGRHK